MGRLEKVFDLLQTLGFKVKKNKCFFLRDSVDYIGHRVNTERIRALPDKIEATVKGPLAQNTHQLRSFLELMS